ncbi:MAG: M18 family aminopeptidase, partial [Methylococcales bacterium]|nr:M18 family aminopeptidase [Methylococcales bacterium]
MKIDSGTRAHAENLLRFIDASPSPWHAVETVKRGLEENSFCELKESNAWSLEPGSRHYVVRDGSSIIAFVTGDQAPTKTGYRIIGAHTDSPGLRIKPKPVT